MELLDPAAFELPSSDSGSGISEWLCPSPVVALPLSQFHTHRHQQAGPLILQLFQSKDANLDSRRRALNRIHSLNDEIHQHNVENDVDREVGTIDVDIFLHAWEDPDSGPYLMDFCRLHHYPIAWALQPPKIGSEYQPYEEIYWKNCDWNTPGMLLRFVWDMRKARVDEDIIEDQELILLEFECSFNKNLGRLHLEHSKAGGVAHFLQSDCLLDSYRILIACLEEEEPELYEQHRQSLRRDCALYDYPISWVPGTYEHERNCVRS
ncbi:hypothetical protein EYZ11_010934 [Aspergillus tanneri]|uniref:Uncharacterized protein n=1 Tax=Aspergillus tanneri TaxID=1220188 RepID=A0A4S3J435_9EURO|nr:uncharacterized protein ATNIH1004_001886 [Aspergillus tanneri]KAA8641421.1 hypothetical protein ATNIH1004_001886 [Aspergillus tanneri]THC89623.1 hypothetical protein EYZ11_010934 [Aspergillus tanneri]